MVNQGKVLRTGSEPRLAPFTPELGLVPPDVMRVSKWNSLTVQMQPMGEGGDAWRHKSGLVWTR